MAKEANMDPVIMLKRSQYGFKNMINNIVKSLVKFLLSLNKRIP